MSQPEVAEILSHQTNAAVVQLPGRRFPGIVIQGDTLASLVRAADDICRLATNAGSSRDLRFEAASLRDRLRVFQAHYETVLASHGIELPYNSRE